MVLTMSFKNSVVVPKLILPSFKSLLETAGEIRQAFWDVKKDLPT